MEFRAFVNQLDQSGELLRINREVAPDYELAALLRQAEARRKALQFASIAGARFAAVGAVLSDPDRHARAICRDPAMLAKPGGWAALLAEARSRPLAARKISGSGVGQNVLTGPDASLDLLPIARFFAGDTHAFITAGLGIARDPVSGVQNVGFYRAPLIDSTHFSVSAGGTSRLAQIYKDAAEQGPTLPVAYVIGAPPALLITAGCRIGREEADLDIAGALQGEALELVQCQTSDLWVPASAEFVIEAEVMLDELIDHVMGEFPDQYGLTRSPVARITAITHRNDALFHTILGGMNREHNSLGSYIFLGLREQLLQELQPAFPGLRDIHVDLTPRRSGGRCQMAVSIDSSATTSPAELIDALYARSYDIFPLALVVQRIVVVDKDVDIRSHNDVEWAIASRTDSAAKVRTFEAPARGGGSTLRLGIDATLDPDKTEAGKRPFIPGAESVRLDDYL